MKVLEGLPALLRLNLEDYDMETIPRYLQDVNPRHLLLDCSLLLLTCIAAGKTGPEWDKFSHIHQVKAYAHDAGIQRKWYVMYTKDHFRFETNISRSAIAKGAMPIAIWFPGCVERACTAVKHPPLSPRRLNGLKLQGIGLLCIMRLDTGGCSDNRKHYRECNVNKISAVPAVGALQRQRTKTIVRLQPSLPTA
ncbi:hypothetical protein C2845_PM17G02780 [Panicum miliaceum]|uniref:Uncharacterized protein n=1 Tax=Panicum miliaceum TaxID=4540 RepID=A0A3L6Q2H1_PANMI|nr:hypothetical protein C2845_PM17G02780 [Panicum miliaceum]